MKLSIRPFRPRAASWAPGSPPDDRSFVVETWISSVRNRPAIVSVGDWHGVMSLAIGRILAQPETRVLMATDADADPGIADLLGWLAFDPHSVARTYDEESRRYEYRRVPNGTDPLVWYCFVKAPYRRHGIARRLFDRAGLDPRGAFHYIARTDDAVQLVTAGKLRRATYRPYLGRPANERGLHAARSEADRAA